MVFTTEGFFEVAIESWRGWYLNPRPLNSSFSRIIARVLFGCVSMIYRDQVFRSAICPSKYCFYVIYIYIYIYVYIYIYIYIYIYFQERNK